MVSRWRSEWFIVIVGVDVGDGGDAEVLSFPTGRFGVRCALLLLLLLLMKTMQFFFV